MSWGAPALLACALAGGTFACGESHGDEHGHADGGPGSGGKGGPGASGGRSGSAGAAPSLSECVDKTTTAASGKIGSECLACLCENGPREAVACNTACWSLIECFALHCADEEPGTPSADGCAVDRCQMFVHEHESADAVGNIVAAQCAAECASGMARDGGTAPPPEMDAGG